MQNRFPFTRRILKGVVVLLAAYVLFLVGFFIAMKQRPEVFSGIMAKTPNISFAILPFRQMWMFARAGKLAVGDEASDFSLKTYDDKSTVRLSALRGKPVVLIFGSYT